MKKYILSFVLIVLAILPIQAQIKYSVTGTVPTQTKYVIIRNVVDNSKIDSITIHKNKFKVKGSLPKNTFIEISSEGRSPRITLIADATPTTVNLSTLNVTGSDINKKLAEYNKSMSKIMKLFESDYQAYRKAKGEEAKKIAKNLNSYDMQLTEVAENAVKENPNNLIPALFIGPLSSKLSIEELKSYLDDSHPYSHHPLCRRAWDELKNKESKAPGKMFTDIEENDINGNPHKLSEYCGKGNYVLIDFWASWCGPCRQEMPNVKSNYEKYHPKGFEIVGLSFDSKPEAWKDAINTMELKWIHLSDLKGWNSNAASTYGIHSIPFSILLDPEGKIITTNLRGDALGNKLKEIYGF